MAIDGNHTGRVDCGWNVVTLHSLWVSMVRSCLSNGLLDCTLGHIHKRHEIKVCYIVMEQTRRLLLLELISNVIWLFRATTAFYYVATAHASSSSLFLEPCFVSGISLNHLIFSSYDWPGFFTVFTYVSGLIYSLPSFARCRLKMVEERVSWLPHGATCLRWLPLRSWPLLHASLPRAGPADLHGAGSYNHHRNQMLWTNVATTFVGFNHQNCDSIVLLRKTCDCSGAKMTKKIRFLIAKSPRSWPLWPASSLADHRCLASVFYTATLPLHRELASVLSRSVPRWAQTLASSPKSNPIGGKMSDRMSGEGRMSKCISGNVWDRMPDKKPDI